jgi:rubrerythrin
VKEDFIMECHVLNKAIFVEFECEVCEGVFVMDKDESPEYCPKCGTKTIHLCT